MKVERKGSEHLRISLTKREIDLLGLALGQYPLHRDKAPTLSKAGGIADQDAAEKLLSEALLEQRTSNSQVLQELFTDPKRFEKSGNGGSWNLSSAEIECLIQALNDVRVSAWMKLGSPSDRIPRLTDSNVREVWLMEVAGFFEMQLLEALDSHK